MLPEQIDAGFIANGSGISELQALHDQHCQSLTDGLDRAGARIRFHQAVSPLQEWNKGNGDVPAYLKAQEAAIAAKESRNEPGGRKRYRDALRASESLRPAAESEWQRVRDHVAEWMPSPSSNRKTAQTEKLGNW